VFSISTAFFVKSSLKKEKVEWGSKAVKNAGASV